jgi:hypothetical protein
MEGCYGLRLYPGIKTSLLISVFFFLSAVWSVMARKGITLVEVEVTLRSTVGQYGLVSSPLRDSSPDITFCLKVAVLFLWGALSDERMGLQSAVQPLNGPSHAELVTLLCCLIWDSPNLEDQVPVFISPRNRVAQLYSRVLGFLYVSSYDSQGYQSVVHTGQHSGSATKE